MIWGLISKSGLTIFCLTFAYAEEILIKKSKLEPIGNVKIINNPKVEVFKDILDCDGEDDPKDHKKKYI